ncbi:M12 family metallopeptidase [Sorangium sp. So ce341]|uniref:M12 family metallopeptidase n=1 Tax=Sorangium sp. So ce341 TaxID=3133302 RepID=UPI003F635687
MASTADLVKGTASQQAPQGSLMNHAHRFSFLNGRKSLGLAFTLALTCGSGAPVLSGCVAEGSDDDLPGGAGAVASCGLTDEYEVLDTGHITKGDIIVGNIDELTAACVEGRHYPLDGKPRASSGGSGLEGYPAAGPLGVGTVSASLKWPAAVVPYQIDPGLPNPSRVLDAIDHWQSLTPISFVPRTNQSDYVYFTNGNACASSVGRQGGRQDIVLSTGKSPGSIVASSISNSDSVYTWYNDGMVSAGTSSGLDDKLPQYPYTLPPGYQISQIRGIAIAKSNNHVYVWYSDGKVSSGTTADLDKYFPPTPFSLPPGKTALDIVEMDISMNDHVYTWFDDGTATIGNSTDLDAYHAPYAYALPPGYNTSMIAGLGIAGSSDWIYAWYTDGKASSGTSADFDGHSAPYAYDTPGNCGLSAAIHEIGHAVGLQHEQSRCDRDSFVRIFSDNIKPGKEGNFDKICGASWDDIGGYNTTSIMQYRSHSFSKNGSPTILAKTPAGQPVSSASVVDMAIASNDWIYTWWNDGTVTAGASNDLERHLSRYEYELPPGYSISDIAGIGIAKSNNHVYVWYKDGKVSSGTSADFDAYLAPYSYTLPSGYTPADIIAVDIASNDHVYVWYANGKASSGTSADLDKHIAPYSFTVAAGRTIGQILGIGFAANDWLYAWYTTGQASAGNSANFDAHLALYPFAGRLGMLNPSSGLNTGDVAAIDIMY